MSGPITTDSNLSSVQEDSEASEGPNPSVVAESSTDTGGGDPEQTSMTNHRPSRPYFFSSVAFFAHPDLKSRSQECPLDVAV